MIVLDGYALVAYLRQEPASQDVALLLRSPTVISAVNVAEVLDQLVRVSGRTADEVHADLALLTYAGLEVRSATLEQGVHAGRLRARHYHRQRMPVSLADCFAAATALLARLPLATADPDLAALVRNEGGDVHPLPDSAGAMA